jgi:cytochrome b involved in lipid metabolism
MKKPVLFVLVIVGVVIAGFIIKGNGKRNMNSNSNQTPLAVSKSISLNEIANHSNASDCWTAINGNVYNLTDFIPGHPGGNIITTACGIDGTSAFNGQGHSGSATNLLPKYQIGVLAK